MVRLAAAGCQSLSALCLRDGEARVVPRQVRRQETMRGLDRGDARQAQFGGEAVLQRAEEPLDAALGLWRVGEDHLHPELAEGTSELRRLALAGELFVKAVAHAAVATEDAVAVAVHRERHTGSHQHLTEHLEVSGPLLLLAERRADDLAGGVGDGGMERRQPALASQPT